MAAKVVPTWFDVTTRWQMVHAAMRLNPAFKPPIGSDPDLFQQLNSSFRRVLRAQVITFHVDENGWHDLRGQELDFTNVIASVGRSSYKVVTMASLGTQKIFSIEVTLVAVDDTLQHSIALPNSELLREIMETGAELLSKAGKAIALAGVLEMSPRPTDAYCWHTVTHWTGCDELGHLNQSQYGLLMEEARAVAAASGGYKDPAINLAAHASPRCFQINYIGQAKPGDMLRIFTWWDGQSFCCEMERDDKVGRGDVLLTTSRIWVNAGASRL